MRKILSCSVINSLNFILYFRLLRKPASPHFWLSSNILILLIYLDLAIYTAKVNFNKINFLQKIIQFSCGIILVFLNFSLNIPVSTNGFLIANNCRKHSWETLLGSRRMGDGQNSLQQQNGSMIPVYLCIIHYALVGPCQSLNVVSNGHFCLGWCSNFVGVFNSCRIWSTTQLNTHSPPTPPQPHTFGKGGTGGGQREGRVATVHKTDRSKIPTWLTVFLVYKLY